jgi:hypothetical protein
MLYVKSITDVHFLYCMYPVVYRFIYLEIVVLTAM